MYDTSKRKMATAGSTSRLSFFASFSGLLSHHYIVAKHTAVYVARSRKSSTQRYIEAHSSTAAFTPPPPPPAPPPSTTKSSQRSPSFIPARGPLSYHICSSSYHILLAYSLESLKPTVSTRRNASRDADDANSPPLRNDCSGTSTTFAPLPSAPVTRMTRGIPRLGTPQTQT